MFFATITPQPPPHASASERASWSLPVVDAPGDGDRKPFSQEITFRCLKDQLSLETETATNSSIPAWKCPWTKRSLAGYSPLGRRVGHDLAPKHHQSGKKVSVFRHVTSWARGPAPARLIVLHPPLPHTGHIFLCFLSQKNIET